MKNKLSVFRVHILPSDWSNIQLKTLRKIVGVNREDEKGIKNCNTRNERMRMTIQARYIKSPIASHYKWQPQIDNIIDGYKRNFDLPKFNVSASDRQCLTNDIIDKHRELSDILVPSDLLTKSRLTSWQNRQNLIKIQKPSLFRLVERHINDTRRLENKISWE